jgi:mono/diheme cytochrome c family protein
MTPVILGLFVLAGCEDNYTRDLKYPLRDDALVVEPFKKFTPKRFDPPGQLSFAVGQVLSSEGDETDRKNILEPSKLDPNQRQSLEQAIDVMFGTPAEPTVKLEDGDLVAFLKLDDATLKKGSSRYREHCLHCHGLTGNGRGPTAPWVNPHPRDYRSGIFKFSSSGQNDKSRKPRREDLRRTLREGIEGTSMPSFGLLPEDEIDAMASYVAHLSIRGQTEFMIMQQLIRGEGDNEDMGEKVKDTAGAIAKWWREAEGALIKPPEPPKDMKVSIQAGFKLFQKDGAGCIACHLDYGRQNNYLNDSWGTIVRAMDLTQGTYRGGRRPVDLYWRIHSGVNGANMPASSAALKPEQIWDLVNFLRVLPYPEMRKDNGIEIH